MSESTRALLLELLTARKQQGGGIASQEVLARLAESDPRMGLLAQYLSSRDAVEAETNASEDDGGATEMEVEAAMESRQTEPAPAAPAGPSRQQRQRLLAELSELRERNDTLAAALGACYLCWGADPACPECAGKGGPGSAAPDAKLFQQIIVPAIKRLRSVSTANPRYRSKATPDHDNHVSIPVKGPSHERL